MLSDFGGVADWGETIVESRSTTVANGGVGARRSFKHRWGKVLDEEIVDWDEGRGFSYEVVGGLGPMKEIREVWTVEPTTGGSTVTAVVSYSSKFGFLGRLLERLIVNRFISREQTKNLSGLKRYLET